MALITKLQLQNALYWVEIPEAGLRILCGCPTDSIKRLRERGVVYWTKKENVIYESGPNAILLSDELVQNNYLCNMTEFPVLQMLYRQGMIIPNHPNNNGNRPILIGDKRQLDAQLEYIYRGNYGLYQKNEYLEAGETEEFAEQHLRIKLSFAYGRFVASSELIDQIVVAKGPVAIRKGVEIERVRKNIFEFRYKNESCRVNLNLHKGKKYHATYQLPKRKIGSHYFSVIHTGEGDGWDHTRPCIGSIVQFNGKLFLIDAGPNIRKTLKALDLWPNNIDGIYFTHAHDDHFAGLHSLMEPDRKVKIYATRCVYATILKKLCALFHRTPESFEECFDYTPIQREIWNNNEGLEVMPIPSPHPVDTTVLLFRVQGKTGYKTYGHYSDITALSLLKRMITEDTTAPGIDAALYQQLADLYKLKMDLKKVDVGGPSIHGDEEDFLNDPSNRLVLTHTSQPLNSRQLEIGEQVQFGEVDVLIDTPPF